MTTTPTCEPLAFRIWDFRSIVDTGECSLSADGITVLAGQNEAGKTAVLLALSEFDQNPGEPPDTSDYLPDGRDETHPRVAVQFRVPLTAATTAAEAAGGRLPRDIIRLIADGTPMWIHRDLRTGGYSVDPTISSLWPESDVASDGEEKVVTPQAFLAELRDRWPQFIYANEFVDALPREILIESLAAEGTKGAQRVRDFLSLAGVDVDKLVEGRDNDKFLTNYLAERGRRITGDFRGHWRQHASDADVVELVVRFTRDAGGKPKLLFYVHDQHHVFPDQRSRGFQWFLSFYLRLESAEGRGTVPRLLLIDEPGTFLHTRAQRDILTVLERRAGNGERVVYSTHSPTLMPPAKLHRVRVVSRSRERGTQVFERLTHPALRGNGHSDALSPILDAIGYDVRDAVSLAREKNLIVEGISDFLYLRALLRVVDREMDEQLNVFPCTGAPSVPSFASLLIGWGLEFAVLLDRDESGESTRRKLQQELNLLPHALLRTPGSTIEDVLSRDDFRCVLRLAGVSESDADSPSSNSDATRRLKLDKTLIARVFSEHAGTESLPLDEVSRAAARDLFHEVKKALSIVQPSRGSRSRRRSGA